MIYDSKRKQSGIRAADDGTTGALHRLLWSDLTAGTPSKRRLQSANADLHASTNTARDAESRQSKTRTEGKDMNNLKTFLAAAAKTCAAVAFAGVAIGCALFVVVPVAVALICVIGLILVFDAAVAVAALVVGSAEIIRHSKVTVNGKTVLVDGKPVDREREPEPDTPDTPEAKEPVNPEAER